MTVDIELLGRKLRYRPLSARTPDGLSIAVQDHDRGGGGRDILFIHGFCQSNLAWLKQVTGPLAERYRLVTYDLRGHGASDKPFGAHFYREPERWADEVAAVIDAAALERPVIVSWSYGGRVLLDYLGAAGSGGIAALVKVASTSNGSVDLLGAAAPLLRDVAQASELPATIVAASALLGNCTQVPLDAAAAAVMLAYNVMVPPEVRRALVNRPAAYDDVLRSVGVPVLTIHGDGDRINRVAMSEHTARTAPGVEQRLYAGIGHMPFWEAAEQFDADLADFVDRIGTVDRTAGRNQELIA